MLKSTVLESVVALPTIGYNCRAWSDVLLDEGHEGIGRPVFYYAEEAFFGMSVDTPENPLAFHMTASMKLGFPELALVNLHNGIGTTNFLALC